MKKKGFTLIELVAVITLLAIIVLVTVPVIINTLSNTEQREFENFKKLVINAAELYVERNRELYPELNEDDGYIEIKANLLVSEGYLQSTLSDPIDNKPISKYKVFIYVNQDKTLKYKVMERKTLYELAITNDEVNSIDYCAKEGICTVGTAFAIQVNDTESYNFYVIADNGIDVTLLMDSNLYEEGNGNPNVAWLNQEQYEAAGGTGWDNQPKLNRYGPLTALKVLKERTFNWTNIEAYNYILEDDNGLYADYSGKYVQNVRSRLPRRSDVIGGDVGCVQLEETTCPIWIYENLFGTGDNNTYAYWLSDSVSENINFNLKSDFAWCADYKKLIGICDDAGNVTDIGIRPVITISKSL